jgi:hypothetical protein
MDERMNPTTAQSLRLGLLSNYRLHRLLKDMTYLASLNFKKKYMPCIINGHRLEALKKRQTK